MVPRPTVRSPNGAELETHLARDTLLPESKTSGDASKRATSDQQQKHLFLKPPKRKSFWLTISYLSFELISL